MKRLHLFEWCDLTWFPQILRNLATDFLEFGANRFDIYRPIVPVIKRGLISSRENKIIDIASGSGGGIISLTEHLAKKIEDLQISLSDFFPNQKAFERTRKKALAPINYLEIPIDARNVPTYITGLRTMFLSFHHFRPVDAKSILQNAVSANQPIGIFEGQQRNFKSLIPMLLSPISVVFMTPFIRPFKVSRFLFTYLLPVLPLVIWWDGIVSVFRTYSVTELNQMIQGLENSNAYHWDTGIKKGKTNDITYLLGIPKR